MTRSNQVSDIEGGNDLGNSFQFISLSLMCGGGGGGGGVISLV